MKRHLLIVDDNKFDISPFQKLETPSTFLEVLECAKATPSYSNCLSFIGLPETHLKKFKLITRNQLLKALSNKDVIYDSKQ